MLLRSPLDISITAPFHLGDVVARVDMEGGESARVVLRSGRFQGQVPGKPVRIALTTEAAPEGEAPLSPPLPDEPGDPKGTITSVEELFEHGVGVPDSGNVTLQIQWGTPCHEEALPEAAPEGTRFGSWEHIMSARLIGKAADGSRLSFQQIDADFDEATRFAVGESLLTFGEIISLAGDFYAHLDAAAARELASAWPPVSGMASWIAGDYRTPTLAGDAPSGPKGILAIVSKNRDKDQNPAGELAGLALDALTADYPARRYLALASQNFCHFGSQGGGVNDAVNEALRLYRAYHARALREATAARGAVNVARALRAALVVDAFGCHFLTDLFASGHIRVPRRVLGERYGVLIGGLRMCHQMHAEDNRLGLWCTRRIDAIGGAGAGKRVVWRAFGDGMLRRPEAAMHLKQVEEAVRRSVAEVFAAYCGAQIPENERAEALLPVPLAPGERPSPRDALPDGTDAHAELENHWPLYWLLSDGRVARREGGPWESRYRYQDEGLDVSPALLLKAPG
jgi:hypothetical protein